MREKRQVLYRHEAVGQPFLAKGMNHIFITMPDRQGLPDFAISTAYAVGDRFVFEGNVYRVATAIASTNTRDVSQLLAADAIVSDTGREEWGDRPNDPSAARVRVVSLQFKSPNSENSYDPWVPYRSARFHREWSRQGGNPAQRETIQDIPASVEAEGIIEFEAAAGVHYRLVVTGARGAGPVATIAAIADGYRRVG